MMNRKQERRGGTLGRVAGLAAAVVLATGLAPSAASAATTCRSVKGTVVKRTPALKVVSQKVAGGKRLVACALPRGPVRVLGANASDADEGSSSGVGVVKTAGTSVLYRATFDEGPGGRSHDTRKVVDVKTGRTRSLWAIELAEGDCPGVNGDTIPVGPPKQFVLGAGGIVAGVFLGDKDPQCSTPGTNVIVFAPGQKPKTVDSGPNGTIAATSLKLTGRTVSWKHSGVTKTATA